MTEESNPMLRNLNSYRKNYQEFRIIFGVTLKSFWEGNLLGFDVIKFDEEFIKPPEGTSTRDEVLARYGLRGVHIIDDLLGIPLTHDDDTVKLSAEDEASAEAAADDFDRLMDTNTQRDADSIGPKTLAQMEADQWDALRARDRPE